MKREEGSADLTIIHEEMTLRSWNYSNNNRRKTLQKEDVKEAIQRTDIFDFLADVIH